MMKRYILIFIFALSVVGAYAQERRLGKDLEYTLDILDQGSLDQAFSYWYENEINHRADSSYAWANAYLGQSFMNAGRLREAEVLLANAGKAMTSLRSNDTWWWQQMGYIWTKSAMLSLYMHDNSSAHESAVNAKVAYERGLFRGFDYAVALAVLAKTTLIRGDLVMARTFAASALYWMALVFGQAPDKENMISLIYIMTQFGDVESQLGYYDEAISGFEAVKQLCQQFDIDPFHIDLHLGSAYANNGDYAKAITCLQPYYETSDNLLGKIESGSALLYSKYKCGHTDLAALAYEIASLQVENTKRMFSFMSGQQKERWWMSYENNIINIVDYILIKSGVAGVNDIIADNEIFTKGLLLRASNELKNAASRTNDEDIIARYNRLEYLKSQWSDAVDAAKQSELESLISSLEKELLTQLDLDIEQVASSHDVSLALDKDEVALEFVRFESIDDSDDAEYHVVIVRKGAREPEIVYLFNESSLVPLLENNTRKSTYQYINELYSTGNIKFKGDRLYNLIWAPIEKKLGGARTVYYSPAGLLNGISLQALTNGKQFIGERYAMHLVSSIGNIPHVKKEEATVGDKAIIYGGIRYDVDEDQMIESSRRYVSTGSAAWDEYDLGTRSGWSYLSGSESEAKTISTMLKGSGFDVRLYSGVTANEESFKSLSGTDVSVIHVATHGFFMSNTSDLKKNAFFNPSMSDKISTIDPMIRSGLLMAGANRAWTGKRSIEGIDDGILTAKEISCLDMSGVDLVVLSACQTGLGDVKGIEGVYGLQRAFKLAGAETMIMSLWKVDDKATGLLMEAFYKEYLAGHDKYEAFRRAIDTVKNFKSGNERIYSSPYYWASFIIMD